jgi:hypothetical protein
MGLSESDISGAVQVGSVELCMKQLFAVAEELEKQCEGLKVRLGPVTRERNPEIEDNRKLTPAVTTAEPVTIKCALAVELVSIIQKLRLVGVQNESLLRNLDL